MYLPVVCNDGRKQHILTTTQGASYLVYGEEPLEVANAATASQPISATANVAHHHHHHPAVGRTTSEDSTTQTINEGRPPLPPVSHSQEHFGVVQVAIWVLDVLQILF